MSYPADGIESTYKNNIDDVRDFLEAKYAENYLVINVSSRTYRTEKLSNRVCVRLWYFLKNQVEKKSLTKLIKTKSIDNCRVPLSLSFKASQSAIFLLW